MATRFYMETFNSKCCQMKNFKYKRIIAFKILRNYQSWTHKVYTAYEISQIFQNPENNFPNMTSPGEGEVLVNFQQWPVVQKLGDYTVGNMEKYEEMCEKYEEISGRHVFFMEPPFFAIRRICFGTRKHSDLFLYMKSERFRKIPSYSFRERLQAKHRAARCDSSYMLWSLEKFCILPSMQSQELGKIPSSYSIES